VLGRSDAMIGSRAPVAQWIEQVPSKHLAAGSSPAGRATWLLTGRMHRLSKTGGKRRARSSRCLQAIGARRASSPTSRGGYPPGGPRECVWGGGRAPGPSGQVGQRRRPRTGLRPRSDRPGPPCVAEHPSSVSLPIPRLSARATPQPAPTGRSPITPFRPSAPDPSSRSRGYVGLRSATSSAGPRMIQVRTLHHRLDASGAGRR
jgi:hypothetical protein